MISRDTKTNPDRANYSSSSAAFQLATELFRQTGVAMQKIPYKGANDSVTAVISGEVTATITDAGPVTSQVNDGQARALAVAAPKRMDGLSDVPTMKEAGADVEAVLWSGIFVPAATPPDVVRNLEAEFVRITRLPDVIARLQLLNVESVGNTSEEFSGSSDGIERHRVKSRWRAQLKIASLAHVRPDLFVSSRWQSVCQFGMAQKRRRFDEAEKF